MNLKMQKLLRSHILYTRIVFAEQKKFELGRSMVEMLGVLAIMGIVGLVRVRMYNVAMNKHHANTLIEQAQRRAVSVAGQINMMGRAPSLAEFSENTFPGGTFGGVTQEGLFKQFGIRVSNVPKAVCENILTAIGGNTSLRRLSLQVTPTEIMSTCTDDNTFLMVYNDDLKGAGGDTEYVSDDCVCQTVCGTCINENGQNICVGECSVNPNQCTQNSDCSGNCVGCVIPEGQTQGACQACQPVEYLESTGTQYIDTKISNWNETFEYEVKLSVRQQDSGAVHTYYGVWDSWSTNGTAVPAIGTYLNHKFRRNFIAGTTVSSDIGVAIGQTGIISLKGDSIRWSKGSSTAFDRNAKVFTNPYNLYLFACNRGGNVGEYSKFPMYYAKFWLNGKQVRDFIPVHAPFQPTGKQNCMYDKVSKTLFCNVGTGDDFLIPEN